MSRKEFFPQAGGEVFPAAEPRKGVPETAQNMQGAGFRVYTLGLTNALDNYEVRVKGNQFWIVDATDLETIANVKFNDVGGEGAPVAKGFAIKGIPFNRVYVSAAAQAGKTITFLTTSIPNAPIEFVNPTNSANEVKLVGGSRLTCRQLTLALVTNTQLWAADASRLSGMIKPIGVAGVTVGDDTTGGLFGTGFPLPLGETLTIDKAPADELRGISTGASVITILEEFRT